MSQARRELISQEMADASFIRQSIEPEVSAAVWSYWHSGLSIMEARAEARLAAVRLTRYRYETVLKPEEVGEIADALFDDAMDRQRAAYDIAETRMRVAAIETLRSGAEPGDAAQAAVRSVAKAEPRPPAWALDRAMTSAIRICTRERASSRRAR